MFVVFRQAEDTWGTALALVEKMHENFLDEAEIAALTQLLFARYGKLQ